MDLPADVKQVEGHLKWMAQANGRDLKANPVPEKPGYLQKLLEAKARSGKSPVCNQPLIFGGEDEVEGQATKQNPVFARVLTRQFNYCLENIFLEELGEAVKRLGRMHQLLEKLPPGHEQLLEPMQYFVEVLQWSIHKLQEPPSSRISKEESDKVKKFQEKWEGLQQNTASQAVILFVKGSFQRNLGTLKEEVYLQTLLEVIKLDPTYHMWHYYGYQSMRQIRRVFKGKQLKAPSPEERELCQTAYRLAPEVFISAFHLGMMFKDCLWMTYYPQIFHGVKTDLCPVDVEESLEKCLQLFEKAKALAAEAGPEMEEWVVKSRFNKADVLLFVKSEKDNRRQGFELLLELVESYPGNAYLQQKLARVYNFGVGKEKMFRDLKKAEHHLKLSLEIRDPRNYFPCLKEFVKLFKYLPPPLPTKEALAFLTLSLEDFPNLLEGLSQTAEVKMWRGCILWIYNPEETEDHKRKACADWIFVAENFPDLRNDLIKMIRNPPFFKYGDIGGSFPAVIDMTELNGELEGMKLQINSTWKALEAVDYLLKIVSRDVLSSKKAMLNEVGKKNGQGQESVTGSTNKETTRRDNYRSGARNPVGKGLADQDDNWRRK